MSENLQAQIARDRFAEAIVLLLQAGDVRLARLAKQNADSGGDTPESATTTTDPARPDLATAPAPDQAQPDQAKPAQTGAENG